MLKARRLTAKPTLTLSEAGQGMAEFALVLPLLALLTFGTLEVAIFLQQQSTLNAAAFLATRAASVVGNQMGPTREAADTFAQSAGMDWLKTAVGGMKQKNTATTSQFSMESKTDRLTGLVSALSGGKVEALDTLSAQATLPLEYNAKKHGQRSITGKPQTYSMMAYDSKYAPPAVLAKASQSLETLRGMLAKIPKIQGVEIPGVDTIIAFPTTGEPFATHGAVKPNPKARNNSGDGGSATSKDYVKPDYEKKPVSGAGDYRIHTIEENLLKYQERLAGKEGSTSGGLKHATNALGKWDGPKPPVPAMAPLIAAAIASKKAAGHWAKGLGAGVEDAYNKELVKEQGLFK